MNRKIEIPSAEFFELSIEVAEVAASKETRIDSRLAATEYSTDIIEGFFGGGIVARRDGKRKGLLVIGNDGREEKRGLGSPAVGAMVVRGRS